MPIEHRIDPERRRVFYEATGDISLREMTGAIDRVVTDPAWQPGFDIYGDHTEIGRIIETHEVRALVQHLEAHRERLEGTRWVVVTKQAASYGMIRMLSVYAEQAGVIVEVFHTPEEAEAWLAERAR